MFTQAVGEIEYYDGNKVLLGTGHFQDINSFEKVKLIFTNDQIEDTISFNFGEDFGDFVLRDLIQTPTGFAISGRMNNGVVNPITNETHDTQYLMEVDFDGNLLNFYNLQQFPYQGDAACMHYYPETNTYYVGGETFLSTVPTQMWLLKMTDGEVVWRNNYGTYNHRNIIYKLLPSSEGGVYAIGRVEVNPGFFFGNFFLSKINESGIMEWSETYSIGYEDQLVDGIQTNDNGFALAGGSNLPGTVSNNKLYPSMLRLDSLNEVLWSRVYFSEGVSGGYIGRVYQVGSNFVCIGGTRKTGIYTEAFIMKVRGSDGEPLWTRIFDYGISYDYFYNFTPVPQPLGGYICVGRADTIETINSELWSLGGAYIVKTNCMGLLTLPQAAFTISQDPNLPARFLFTNQSQYAYPDSIDGGYYHLDWGDGSPPYLCGQGYAACSANTIPHTYQTEGIYGVTLQAIVCNDTSTLTQSVCLGFAPNPQAGFSYEDTGGTIIFTNLSQNDYLEQGGQLSWDFGDGSPPVSEEHPTHSYEENGTYTVTLTLVVCADTSVYSQEVVVQTVGVSEIPSSEGLGSLIVYPNPAQNTLQFIITNPPRSLSEVETSLTLYNLTGQTLLQTSLAAGETVKTVSVAHLPVGLYVYVAEQAGGVVARGKVAVVR
ncbi:MAG: T9SS type A sorting domain-containing protein [Sphingobacteriales bacterium]|nr:MAG: T9SS type A sorting domain-containing protein [Sphingobacteriales bacterium]